jgi:hypothetical protein
MRKQHGSKLASTVAARIAYNGDSEPKPMVSRRRRKKSIIDLGPCSIGMANRGSAEAMPHHQHSTNGKVQSLCVSRLVTWSSIVMVVQLDQKVAQETMPGGSNSSEEAAALLHELQWRLPSTMVPMRKKRRVSARLCS